jgi:glutamate-1-semialdehyde 2,1-aminomutase
MTDRYMHSRTQHARARQSLAGGVATAIRAGQRPVPITFVGAQGARLIDLDGNEYVDFALAYGPMMLGHSPEPVLGAVRNQLSEGLAYGASHRREAEAAEAVCRTVPCAEMCVFSNSGSEAIHAALRIARAATGRTRVVKFLGHFHGWLDPLAVGTPRLADAGPSTHGQDPSASASVTVCRWNDLAALRGVLDEDVAAVIMEPVAVNGGCFLADPDYLQAVREVTAANGAVLIFDEVITGFRLALGGAQERYGVLPDLAVLGKALGSGFPISAVCGRAELMQEVARGRVAHIGTFNLNPICASAACAVLNELETSATWLYPQLEAAGARLAETLRTEATRAGLPLVVNQVGAAAYAFWSHEPVPSYEDSLASDGDAYRRFVEACLDEGLHLIPRGLLYLSAAHGEAEFEWTQQALRRACAAVAETLSCRP